MEIKNRQVLITGASSGIGRAFAKVCAQDKAHLHLVLRKNNPELLAELKEAGAKSIKVWEADLSHRASVDKLVNQLHDQTIDILFNNAGLFTGGFIEKQSMPAVHEMIQVNVTALIQLTHAVLPGMLKRKRGKIINNSSVAAYMHAPSASTYVATKAAVVAFTNSIRVELKETPVSTLLLITPAIKTKMLEDIESVFGDKLKVPQEFLLPSKYADMIREAVLEDLSVLEPTGLTGFGLKIAKFVPPLFQFGMQKRFTR